MTETDRRSLIVGAVATLFTGLTLPEALAGAAPVIPRPDKDDLWRQIYAEMLSAFKAHFGVPDTKSEQELILLFTDCIYENIKATERLLSSFQISVASASELIDWEKQQRVSPMITIKGGNSSQ